MNEEITGSSKLCEETVTPAATTICYEIFILPTLERSLRYTDAKAETTGQPSWTISYFLI